MGKSVEWLSEEEGVEKCACFLSLALGVIRMGFSHYRSI